MKLILLTLGLLLPLTTWSQNQNLPEAPKPQRTVDRNFVLMMTADAGMSFLDIYTSSRASHNTNCYETNPVYGGSPSTGRFVLQMGAQTAAMNFIGYELKKHHKWWWFAFPMVDGEQHLIGAFLTKAHGC